MMEFDPDRELWLPSRRKFFFLGLAAGVAPFLPDVPQESWTVQFDLATVGEEFHRYTAIFPKSDPSKPSRFLIDGRERDFSECPVTLGRNAGPLMIGWGQPFAPNVSLKSPRFPIYVQSVMMFDDAARTGSSVRA
jgi:hypothetical protein